MSENLMDNVAPHLAPPVTREAIRTVGGTETGAELALPGFPVMAPPCFADDDAE